MDKRLEDYFMSKGDYEKPLIIDKIGEEYVFFYDFSSSSVLLQTLTRYAIDPERSFTWYDAAILSQKVIKLKKETEESIERNPLNRL